MLQIFLIELGLLIIRLLILLLRLMQSTLLLMNLGFKKSQFIDDISLIYIVSGGSDMIQGFDNRFHKKIGKK